MKALKQLLDDLDAIGMEHMEVEDTDVREQMYAVVYHGFIEQTPGFALPDTFGMFEEEGNQAVRDALTRYLNAAVPEAEKLGLAKPEQRFRAFENGDITSDGGKPYDDFFGSAETYEGVKAAFGR
jgi:hypothetical protein